MSWCSGWRGILRRRMVREGKVMIKLVNIQQLEGRLIKVDVLIEGKINNTFEVVFSDSGDVVSSTANDKQKYYKAQARIAFRKYVGEELPNEICSMWY